MTVSGKVTIYILEGPGELDSLNNGGSQSNTAFCYQSSSIKKEMTISNVKPGKFECSLDDEHRYMQTVTKLINACTNIAEWIKGPF